MNRSQLWRAAAGLLAVGVAALATGWPEVSAVATPGPAEAPQYYFDQWDVSGLWAQGARGQGVTIAELDTGVNASVQGLAGKVLPGTNLGTGPNGGGEGTTDRDLDKFGHGTAMASLMVADPGVFGITGIAPDARILPVALPLKGTTDAADEDQLPQAIRYAADNGASIISMSLGEARQPEDESVPCPAAEQEAVFYAMDKGAILVAASGNQGLTGSPVVDPGVCLGVVSVGAVDAQGRAADFSSRHAYLTVSAPGVAIASLSRVPGSAYTGDGTSQATALTAAGLALVRSAHPELSASQVVARLLQTASPAPGATAGIRDPAFGFGRIAIDRAVRADVAPDTPDPVYDEAAPFLAQYRARLQGVAYPQPPPHAATPIDGRTPSGSPPARFSTRVWASVAVALCGLFLAAIGLFRRPAPAVPAVPAAAALPIGAEPAMPPPGHPQPPPEIALESDTKPGGDQRNAVWLAPGRWDEKPSK